MMRTLSPVICQALHSDLEFRVEENKQQSIAKREEINKLWIMLDIPQDETDAFLATAPKHTPSCIAKLEEELQRLRSLRLQNIAVFIGRLDLELRKLWEDCFVAEEDQEKLSPDIEATEAALEQYESAIAHWEEYKINNNKIIKAVTNFKEAFDRLLFVEERQKDKNRLKDNRGGKLLQEEKELKKVKKDVPRYETQLLEADKEISENGSPFLIYGQRIKEYVDNLWDRHDLKRECEKIKRMQAKQLEVDGHKGSTSKRPPSPRLTTPASICSSKRSREENEQQSSKRAKTAMSGTLFPSPTKAMGKSPTKAMSIRPPLSERNLPAKQTKQTGIVPKIVLSTSADTSLHSTLSYDKFESELSNRAIEENIHSSILQHDPAPTEANRPSQRLHNALHLASPRKSVAFAENKHRASSHILRVDSPMHSTAAAIEDKRYSPTKKWQTKNQLEHKAWGYGGAIKRSASLASLDMKNAPLWRVGSQQCLKPAASPVASPVKSPTRRKL